MAPCTTIGMDGDWHGAACVRGDYRQGCICASPANSSSTVSADLAALKAPSEQLLASQYAQMQSFALAYFLSVAAISLLPAMCLLLNRAWASISPATVRVGAVRMQGPASSGLADRRPSDGGSNTQHKLNAASRASMTTRLRVSGGLFQLGWALFCFPLAVHFSPFFTGPLVQAVTIGPKSPISFQLVWGSQHIYTAMIGPALALILYSSRSCRLTLEQPERSPGSRS